MPFPRPKLSDLRAAAAADISAALPGSDALLRYSNLGVLANVLAAQSHGHYGYLDWISREAVPFTATGEFLEAWAALKGVTRKPASAATGTVTFTGGNGTPIPSGTPINRGDGAQYVTTALATITLGAASPPVVAVVAGAAGTLTVGAAMSLGVSLPGINAGGIVAATLTPGTDLEADADLRSRMLEVYQAPPQGGDADDYVTWALEAPGVTRAWTVPLELGAGTVSVYFMMDVAEAAFGGFPQGTNGVAAAETRDTPAAGDQLTVANLIYPLRPVTALVYAKAPGQNTVTFTIAGLTSAPAAVKAAIGAAIAGVFLTFGAPGATVDVSYIESAIAAIAGTAGYVITAIACTHGSVTPGAAGNILSNAGFIPVVGTITYP